MEQALQTVKRNGFPIYAVSQGSALENKTMLKPIAGCLRIERVAWPSKFGDADEIAKNLQPSRCRFAAPLFAWPITLPTRKTSAGERSMLFFPNKKN